MIEINRDKIYIEKKVRPMLFKVLKIMNKWKDMFPELNDSISKLLILMSLLHKKTGHIFSEIINGDRVISVPDIEYQFLEICGYFINKGILIKPVNKTLHDDIEKIVELTQELNYD